MCGAVSKLSHNTLSQSLRFLHDATLLEDLNDVIYTQNVELLNSNRNRKEWDRALWDSLLTAPHI